jgi:flavin-dependent thymidylate synthase
VQASALSTGPAVVTLRDAPLRPFAGAIAAARTCYAPRVIGTDEVTERQRDSIGKLTYEGGHHTVFQHAHFEFGLENVSRQLVWSFLHSHPFYNSEQQSQRYVKLNEPRAFVPPLTGEALAVYEQAIVEAWASYGRLAVLLKDDTFRILKDLRYVTPRVSAERLKTIEREAEKKAIETARYVIPLAAFTAMVHTVSGITLYRLWRMAESGDAPWEARRTVQAMVEAVRGHDPDFFDKVGEGPLPAGELPEASIPRTRADGDAFVREFDDRLEGRIARLIDASPGAEEVVADAVRAAFGVCRDELPTDEALERLLNPALNRYRLESLNLSYHSPLMRALNHATYTFAKRLSHTADSQDQRHRMVPASRPMLTLADTREPDYVTPRLIAANAEARVEYDAAMRRAWAAKNRLRALGVPTEFAIYVLPNAKVVRCVESGPLIALVHKWTMRTCFNAQEEIYQASLEEIAEVQARHPRLARHLGPPCVVRNGLVSPRCTEGTHFCGVPVWRDWPHVERRL